MCAAFAEAEAEAAAERSAAFPAKDGDVDVMSMLTRADISEAEPGPEGTQRSLANGDLSRADGDSSGARMEEDVEMQERPSAESVDGIAANGYMDLDGMPSQASFLASPDAKEQPAAHGSASNQPAIKVCALFLPKILL